MIQVPYSNVYSTNLLKSNGNLGKDSTKCETFLRMQMRKIFANSNVMMQVLIWSGLEVVLEMVIWSRIQLHFGEQILK